MVRKTFPYDGTGLRSNRLYRVEDHVPLPSDTTPPTDPETGEPAVQETPPPEAPPAAEEPAGNASTEEWAAYAASINVEVPEDAGREAIKEAIAEAGSAQGASEPAEEGEGTDTAPEGSEDADEAGTTPDDPFAAAAASLK